MVREKDTVARLGGDEFAVLIESLTDENEAFTIAGLITSFIDQPLIIEDHPIFIGTRVGVLFSDDRYENPDIMLRDADIREAISQHEFIPYFQPIVQLLTNTLNGFEALAR